MRWDVVVVGKIQRSQGWLKQVLVEWSPWGRNLFALNKAHCDTQGRQVQQQALLLLVLLPSRSSPGWLCLPTSPFFASPNREVPSPAADAIAGAHCELHRSGHAATAHCLRAALCSGAAGVC